MTHAVRRAEADLVVTEHHLVDARRQRLRRRVVRTGDRHDEVELLERVGRAQEDREPEQRRTHRQRDRPEHPEAPGAIDLRRLVDVLRDRVQSGEGDEHHERGPHPDVDQQDRDQLEIVVGEPLRLRQMQRREKLIQDAVVAVQDQVPEQRQDDRAEHHRNEQDGEDDGLAGHAVPERQRQHEPEHELDGDREQHEQGRRRQRVGVLRLAEQHRVVARADRLDRAAREVGVREAEIDVEQQRKQIHREQQQEGRRYERPRE